MFLGARASCPHRAEGPQSAERSDMPEPATPPPEARPRERCSWERGHLARNGPKARKAPRGATCPSRLLPRPRGGDGSDGVSRERGCRPLAHTAGLRPACGRDARAPRGWPRERCPGSAGILPATGRRPARRREERHARAGYSPARGVVMGVMGSPGSAGVARARRVRPACGRDARAPRGALGVMGFPESAGRPLAHVAGLRPACGRDARAPRGGERCSWECPMGSPEGW